MTILIDPRRTLTLGKCDWENNPFVLWDNKATASNISSVTGVAADGAVTNAINGTTFDYALPLVSAFDSAGLSLNPVSGEVSAAGIAAHNLGTIGATVAIEFQADEVSGWTDCGAGPITPDDDQAILWRFKEREAGDWRLIITDIPEGQPAIGVFFLGKETIFPQRLYQSYRPILTPTNVALQSNVSEGGHLLGSSVTRAGSSGAAEIMHLEDTFIRSDDWLGFQNHFNAGKGFFWAWRPAKYGDVYYGWRSGDVIAPSNSPVQDRMAVNFQARFYHE